MATSTWCGVADERYRNELVPRGVVGPARVLAEADADRTPLRPTSACISFAATAT